MPRPNPGRSMFTEDNLAARIKIEREKQTPPWTLEGLAKRMTDVGCPMAASAIYKIEQGQPTPDGTEKRRRIVVDELVAFSRVFGISVEQLLLDPEIEAEQRVIDKLNLVSALAAALDQAEGELITTVEEVRGLVKGSKGAKAAMDKYLVDTTGAGPYFRVLTALENTERLYGAPKQTEQPETEED